MQASTTWTAPTGTLGRIVDEARLRVAGLRDGEGALRAAAERAATPPSFREALLRANVAVIAEVKRRSPSKGWIREGVAAADQASAYAHGGAAAISVLTEPAHFDGRLEDLDAVRAAVAVPTLRKDFHVDPVQLVEARAHGASAVLLIARALDPRALERMMDAARELALDALVEIRDEEELTRALDAGATIVGVNNRDLESLVIDPETSERVIPRIPADVVAVAESGVAGRVDVERYAAVGADAVLVGSAITAAPDPVAAVRALADVPRRSRRGH